MICADVRVRFRLLDGNVGWDPYFPADETGGTEQVTGLYDAYGLRLNNLDEPRVTNDVISPFIPPAWIAPGCRPGEWYLCDTKPTGDCNEAVLVQRDPCYENWIDLRQRLAIGETLKQPRAVAADKHRLAVIDSDGDRNHRVLIWSIPDGRLAGLFELDPFDKPHAVSFTSWRELIVSVIRGEKHPETRLLLRYDLAGRYRGEIEVEGGAPDGLPLIRLRTANDGTLWAAEGNPAEAPPQRVFHLWRIAPAKLPLAPVCGPRVRFDVDRLTDVHFYHHSEDRLGNAFRRTTLISVASDHFCINEPTSTQTSEKRCFKRDGTSIKGTPVLGTTPESKLPEGTLETEAIDSVVPRCQWHRLRIEADLPPNTSYTIEVASSEDQLQRPHPSDWQVPAENVTDLLIDQPPGRYLFVRMKLTGTTNTTPVIRRVRIDFPRATSLEQLPTIYRDNPEAEDFTERFLSLFDAATEDLDRAIERFPALLDPDGVPDEVLTWLGMFLGILFDSDWDSNVRRRLLRAAPSLYRKRGTVVGLSEAVELIFGEKPHIDERAFHRAWGVLKENSQLGTIRLFGKSQSRFRIGRSTLGVAPLRSFGNPDHDPVRKDAHQFIVNMPPTRQLHSIGVNRLNQLIETQKPAHTHHQLRIGGRGFVIGNKSAIGIDTQFVAPAPMVLLHRDEDRNFARLGAGVLRSGPNRPTSSMHIGDSSAIGIHTQLE